MSAIRKLAVQEESTMVAWVQLHNMHQDRDGTVRSFCAHLHGQAGICKFTTQCPSCDTNVNYTEHILCDVLTHGLADSKIQLDLLGDKSQDMTLEEVLQFVEAKESNGQLVTSSRLREPTQLAVNIKVPKTENLKTASLPIPLLTRAITVANMAMARTPLPGLGN